MSETPFSEIFLSNLPKELRASFATGDALEAGLRSLCEQAAAAWPALPVLPEIIVRHLASSWPADAGADPVFRRLHPGDLHLCCASLAGQPAALAAFEQGPIREIPRMLSSLGLSPDETQEIQQQVREYLLVKPEGGTARIAEYRGHASLRAWVRVIAVSRGLDLIRKKKARGPAKDLEDADRTEVLIDILGSKADPQAQAVKALDRQLVAAAILAAFNALEPEQRTLLHLHYFEGLSMDRLGRIYGVDRTQIWRRIDSVKHEVRTKTREILCSEHRLARDEAERLTKLVLSQLDLSLSRRLQEE